MISIDEFRTTVDEGSFAFHITNPITGKTLDIIADRSTSYLKYYFMRFPYDEQKKVKIHRYEFLRCFPLNHAFSFSSCSDHR